MSNGLTRGVPVQDLPENQDPSVRYFVDEVTQAVFPWEPEDFREKGTETPEEEEAPAPKRRGRRSKADRAADRAADRVTPAADPDDDDPTVPAENAADPTSLREVGS